MDQISDTKSYLDRLSELVGKGPEILEEGINIPEAATEKVTSKEQVDTGNSVFVVQGRIALESVEDKIIIMLDPFRTGFECKICDGTGIEPQCLCKTGLDRFDQPCKRCGGNPNTFLGKECRTCKGIGSLLVIPESAKSLPTSGRIVSMGPKCEKMPFFQRSSWFRKGWWFYRKTVKEIGQRYLFGVHVGYFLPFKGNILLRCMREHEILCRIYSLDKHIAMGDYFAVPDETANMNA